MKHVLTAIFLTALLFVFASCSGDKKAAETQAEVPAEEETTIASEPAAEEETEDEDNYVNFDEYDDDDDYDEDEEEETGENEKNDLEEPTTKAPAGSGNPYPYEPAREYYSYLTGIKCTRKQQKKRPVSIIINNIKVAMPTVGISHADIIYECMVEGGITRLMAVVSNYDDVPVFGSVRSSREYFIDLSRTHDTIYVHAGGNPQDYDQFDIRPIERMDGVNMHFPNTFYRDQVRRRTMAMEHTLMTSGAGIIKGIEERKYRTTYNSDYKGAFNFYKRFTSIGGTNNTANYICVPFSNGVKPEFLFNPDDKLYYRKQYGAAHIDGETGEQLRFENVIVLFAEYTPFRGNAIAIREGHWKCDLTGSGYGFYITNGKYKIIKWQKETRESIMYLYNMDNSKLYLNPGKSFVCVTSTAYNKSVVINSDLKDIG